jgi:hypothetical protein
MQAGLENARKREAQKASGRQGRRSCSCSWKASGRQARQSCLCWKKRCCGKLQPTLTRTGLSEGRLLLPCTAVQGAPQGSLRLQSNGKALPRAWLLAAAMHPTSQRRRPRPLANATADNPGNSSGDFCTTRGRTLWHHPFRSWLAKALK